jgi:hypothetical protein
MDGEQLHRFGFSSMIESKKQSRMRKAHPAPG